MFLTKDLLVSWQRGERWFMRRLVDGDLAANNGGWQWSAGTGTDAAPYFRIFNPVTQGKKFDADGAFIRRWVPELAGLDGDAVHEPWETPLAVGRGRYPHPIVDHAVQRDRCLAMFKAARAEGDT
jgi:deoxyribodipyrimidine photo-lyase